jgi:hypothetical protein
MKQRFRESATVGFFNPIEEAADVATSAWDKTEDVATSVMDRVPGGSLIKDGINTVTGPVGDFVKGPLQDFSKTTVGETIMRAFSVAVSMSAYMLSPTLGPLTFAWVGPTLAFAAWSIPGLAKGESFDEALVKEFAYRVAYCVSIFSKEAGEAVAKALGPTLSDQLTRALNEGKRVAQREFPGLNTEEAFRQLGLKPEAVLQSLGLTPRQLTDRLGIREDMAAYALAWIRRDPSLIARAKTFDPITGRDTLADAYDAIRKTADAAKMRLVMDVYAEPNPCDGYVLAVRSNLTELIGPMKANCERYKAAREHLTHLAAQSPCDAYVEAVKAGQAGWAAMLKDKCSAFKVKSAVAATAASYEDASAKATRNYVLAGLGILLAAGGTVWYLRKRG